LDVEKFVLGWIRAEEFLVGTVGSNLERVDVTLGQSSDQLPDCPNTVGNPACIAGVTRKVWWMRQKL
jgi:hypothetical protein